MKACLNCGAVYQTVDWTCPSCLQMVPLIDGFRAFAPDLALSNDGMAPDAHDQLDQAQARSFWFRVRNRLLSDMARKYADGAQSVLEIGCGTGYVLSMLATVLPEAKMAGSEIYANGLPYAQKRVQRAEFFQMDARHIPFEAEFDLIAACDVLEHIDDDEGAIREMRKALRPGGKLLLTVPQHQWLWSQVDDEACHKRRYASGELSTKLRRAGFAIRRNTSFVSLLLPVLMLQRLTQGRQKDYDGASELAMPPWMDRLLEIPMEIDRLLISLGLTLPAGGSRLVVAQLQ